MITLRTLVEQRTGLALRILIAEVLFVALFWSGSVDYKNTYSGTDLAQYRKIAQSAPSFDNTIPAPFAYRIGVPWMVSVVSPKDDASGFKLIQLVLVLALYIQFFRVLKLYGTHESTALIIASTALWNPYLGEFLLFNPFQAGDTCAYLLMLIALEGFKRNSVAVFALALLLGATVRETTMLIVPAIVLAELSPIKKRLFFLAAALPSMAMYVIIRSMVPIGNPDWSILSTLVSYAPEVASVERWGRLVVNTCAPLSLLFGAFAWRERTTRWFVTEESYLAAAIVACSFLGGDVERLAAPVTLLLLIIFRSSLERCLDYAPFRYLLAIGIVFCSLHFLYARYTILPKMVYYGGAVFFCGVVLWTGLRAAQNRTPELTT